MVLSNPSIENTRHNFITPLLHHFTSSSPHTFQTMKIYHNPRCSKSRQTLQLIKDAGVEPEVIEYLTDVPSKAELKELVAMLGIKPYDLLRRGETDFKENFKGKDLSDDEWIAAMVKYPKLIERPIVVKQKKAVLGRPPENVKTLL